MSDKRYTKPIPSFYRHTWGTQPTFTERCEAHPDHATGMVTNEMICARLREESEDLRAENERLRVALQRQATPTRWGSPVSADQELHARQEAAAAALAGDKL
jgi:hypothetical protein